MLKKGDIRRRLHSFMPRMVTSAFHNQQLNQINQTTIILLCIYFRKTGCVDLNILAASFPYPMAAEKKSNIEQISESTSPIILPCTEPTIPPRPNKIPFTPTIEDIPKLEQYLHFYFSTTAFSKSSPFPSMSATPAHIYLKSNAVPYAKHTPISVPFHWKQEVKELLDKHVKKSGILQEVPFSTPVQWCSTMIVTAKKDGRPRITVDLQHLSSQCLRETHQT